MILLSATGLCKSYGTDTILNNVSFHINEGDRIGIVGKNGAGKTTLMNMLTGHIDPDQGDIFMSPQHTIGYLRQRDQFHSDRTVYQEVMAVFQDLIEMEAELGHLSAKIAEGAEPDNIPDMLEQYDRMSEDFKKRGGYSFRKEAEGILASMAFPEETFEKQCSVLSGGERTRLALACLLLKKPSLLLLDEPTNHLDIGTLKWLEQYLKGYKGTILLISHDRYFLDQTVNRIFEIENHKCTIFNGNYSEYVQKKKSLYETAMRHYEKEQKEIQRQEEMIRRFKQHGTEKLAKRARSREIKLENMERSERPESDTGKMKISFREEFPSGNMVAETMDLYKSFGQGEEERVLFRHVNFEMRRGERICMVGPNGTGKTTFLKILMGLIPPSAGKVREGHNVAFGYYDQEQKLLTDSNTVLQEIHNAYRLYTEREVRSILGRFQFQNDDVFKQVRDLSGGEKARLSLLKLMLSGANTLLLDEPTNHLDIASKETFEDAILDFPGTVLIISHDRYLLNKLPTRIVELNDDGITSYLGGYDYYVEKKQSISSGKSYLEDLSKKTGGAKEEDQSVLDEKQRKMEERRLAKEQQAKDRKREREKLAAETRIGELEAKIEEIHALMCLDEYASNYEKLGELNQELTAAQEELEQVYERWMELE